MPNSDQIVGIALNGVFLFAGATYYKYDAYFPKLLDPNLNVRYTFDVCLGTYESFRTYRYHMFSPCILSPTLKDISALCSSNNNCNSDIKKHSVSLLAKKEKTMIPIGTAKDGRVIYGPYKANGQLWQPCDVDICNGRREGNTYYYVSSMFFPYFVGCWGPGNSRSAEIKASCSANHEYECLVQNAMSVSNSLGMAILIAFAILLAL